MRVRLFLDEKLLGGFNKNFGFLALHSADRVYTINVGFKRENTRERGMHLRKR